VVAWAVKQVSATRGIQIEENSRNDNDLLLQTGLEEVETVGDGLGKTLEVQPQVEGRVWDVFNDKSHFAESTDDVVSLVAEVALQMGHLDLDQVRLQHGNGGFLQGVNSTAVKVATARSDSADVLLGAKDPSNTPSGKSEALGETVNDEDVVLVDILDVLGSRDGGAVAVASVVVSRVELVADKGGAATADVLDLGELRVGNDSAGGVSGVGGQNDGGTTGNFLGNLVGVDVIAVLLGQGDGDGGKLMTGLEFDAVCWRYWHVRS
jgi:hypothetical protein